MNIVLGIPSVIQVRHGKCMFFLGDHWVLMGPVEYQQVTTLPHGHVVEIPMVPDPDDFFERRSDLDDGSEDWRVWGPRVN